MEPTSAPKETAESATMTGHCEKRQRSLQGLVKVQRAISEDLLLEEMSLI